MFNPIHNRASRRRARVRTLSAFIVLPARSASAHATRRPGGVGAVGSGDAMGLDETDTVTTLARTRTGYYGAGSCP